MPDPTPTETQPVRFHAMIYGNSGTGKTAQLAEYARQAWKTGRKRTRYITFDNGGTAALDSLRYAGVCDVVEAQTLFNPALVPADKVEAVVRALFQGGWPTINGNRISWTRDTSPASILIIEGLDNVCSTVEKGWVSSALKIGQETVGKYEVQNLITGAMESGGKMSQSHFGALQSLIKTTLLPGVWGLPYEDVIVTTHESSGQDSDEGTPGGVIYGPATIGKALTSKIAANVPVLLRTDLVVSKEGSEYRCYFSRHRDPNRPQTLGADYPANHRLPLSVLGEFQGKFPGSYFAMTPAGDLARFIQTWKDLQRKAAEDLL